MSKILLKTLLSDRLLILSTPLDSLKYHLIMENITDLKDNVTARSDNLFFGSANADTLAPKLLFVSPENGETIFNLIPNIVLEFSELLLSTDVSVNLLALESGKSVKR